MISDNDIPVLTDLIESGPEITLSDLGLENELAGEAEPVFSELQTGDMAIDIDPALEQSLRRILDEHTELAWQEIRLAIQQHLNRS
jgi:hypothetical protein